MTDKLWPGLVVFALLLAVQIVLQRKEKPLVKWLGGGLMVLSAFIWLYTTYAIPHVHPVGWLVLRLEPFVPSP